VALTVVAKKISLVEKFELAREKLQNAFTFIPPNAEPGAKSVGKNILFFFVPGYLFVDPKYSVYCRKY
jgi:hypothetical protein